MFKLNFKVYLEVNYVVDHELGRVIAYTDAIANYEFIVVKENNTHLDI